MKGLPVRVYSTRKTSVECPCMHMPREDAVSG